MAGPMTNIVQLRDKKVDKKNLLAVVEGVQSRFFLATAAAEVIGHVCQTRFECPVGKG